jgi:hypothetical protein
MASLPEITDVKRLTIRPGDTLIVRLGHTPDMDEAGEIVTRLKELLGTVPVIVLGPDEDIEVLEAGQPAPAEGWRLMASPAPVLCGCRVADASNRGRMCADCGLPMVYVPAAGA